MDEFGPQITDVMRKATQSKSATTAKSCRIQGSKGQRMPEDQLFVVCQRSEDCT